MKTFRLFKRDDTGRELAAAATGYKDRPYYFKFTFHGKCYVRCLETNDANEAARRARLKAAEIKDAVSKSDYLRLDRTRLRTVAVATVADVTEAYTNSSVDASASTRKQNVLALRQLLRIAYAVTAGEADAELDFSVDRINGSVARRWFELASQLARDNGDQAATASIKRSANSRFVQAKSVFCAKAAAVYKELGFLHPSFEDFLKAGDTFKFSRLPRLDYTPPADNVIAATLAAWQRVEDRNLFLTVGHALAFGLRAGEISQCKWKLWKIREGYPVLDGAIDVKNGSGLIQVRALDPWFTTMRLKVEKNKWQTGPEDYILVGNPTIRTEDSFRAVSAWLRNLGWQTQKTNHELRKYAGSQIAMKYGIYEAQCWLRHSTVTVTEQHYSGYVKRFKPENTEVIPARWASLQPAPALSVIHLNTGA